MLRWSTIHYKNDSNTELAVRTRILPRIYAIKKHKTEFQFLKLILIKSPVGKCNISNQLRIFKTISGMHFLRSEQCNVYMIITDQK